MKKNEYLNRFLIKDDVDEFLTNEKIVIVEKTKHPNYLKEFTEDNLGIKITI